MENQVVNMVNWINKNGYKITNDAVRNHAEFIHTQDQVIKNEERIIKMNDDNINLRLDKAGL